MTNHLSTLIPGDFQETVAGFDVATFGERGDGDDSWTKAKGFGKLLCGFPQNFFRSHAIGNVPRDRANIFPILEL